MITAAWTDGSSIGNPGPAAWAVLVDGQLYSEYVGVRTNNQAEVLAIFNAIIRLPPNASSVIFTDSRCAIGWFSQHWNINTEFVRAYKRIIDDIVVSNNMNIVYSLVKAHSGIYENELVDTTAHSVAKRAMQVALNAPQIPCSRLHGVP